MPKKSTYGKNNIGIDDSEFQRKAKKLVKKYGISEKEFIKDQSRLLAREAAKFTPPFAVFPDWNKGTAVGSKADIEQGEWAIYYDLKKIFAPVGDDTITKKLKYYKGGPVYRRGAIVFAGIARNVSEMKKWHSNNKRANGRTRDLPSNGAMLCGWSLFNKYAKTQQKKAGIAKAAFWKASLGFGGKSPATPKIKRHLATTSGSGIMVKTRKGHDGKITARADGLFHTMRFLPHLRRNRLEKAVKRLEYIGKKVAKESGFKVR